MRPVKPSHAKLAQGLLQFIYRVMRNQHKILLFVVVLATGLSSSGFGCGCSRILSFPMAEIVQDSPVDRASFLLLNWIRTKQSKIGAPVQITVSLFSDAIQDADHVLLLAFRF